MELDGTTAVTSPACPAGHANLEGASYCSACGAQLPAVDAVRTPGSTENRSRRRWVSAGVVLVTVALLAGGILLLHHDDGYTYDDAVEDCNDSAYQQWARWRDADLSETEYDAIAAGVSRRLLGYLLDARVAYEDALNFGQLPPAARRAAEDALIEDCRSNPYLS